MRGNATVEFRGSAGFAQLPHKVPVFLSCLCHPLPLSHTIVTMSHTQHYSVVVRVLVTHQPFLGSTLSTRLGTVGFFSVVPISIPSGKETNGGLPLCVWSTPGNCWDDDQCQCLAASFSPWDAFQSCKTCPLYNASYCILDNLSCNISYWFLDKILP